MYSAGELERASMALDEPMYGLEHRIMTDIVRRIRENGEITAAADWQITRLIQLGMAMEEITAAINEALGAAEGITDNLFSNIIEAGYARDNNLYKAIGKVQIPFNENAPLQQMISAVTAQTNETMHNITQSLGFAQRGADGRISFTPIADYYQKTLDNAMLDISSGAFDYNTVLNRTVKEMTNSGLRTVDYATGWSNRVPVAARRAVMTGMNQLTAKKNEQDAEELHTNWFEISWHSGARPSHWWGGRQYTKEQLTTICNLGDVTGLCGANCYHNYHPFIPGISIPVYTEEELEELNRQEKEPIEWNGKKYTKYEATQRQRQLETTMRAQREEMALLEEGGADEDDLINCRARYHGTSHEYAQFSKAMGLPQERERVYADGLGTKLMQGKTEGGSGKDSPVKVPAVGAHVVDTVTPEERKELLSRGKVVIAENAKTTAKSRIDAEEGIHSIKGKKKFEPSVNMDCVSGSKPITEQLQKELSNEYDKFTEIFGKLDNVRVVTAVPYKKDGVWGAFNDNSNELFLFGIGGDNGRTVMTKTAKKNGSKGLWSTESPYHAYRHELGHAWQKKAAKQDLLYDKKIEKISKIRDDINDNINKALTDNSESDIIKLRKGFLSDYGLDPDNDIDEFISECIAEYCDGSPRETSRSVINILFAKEL